MHKRNTDATGFTIVELLIVVVVIAILAAISIVAYTNIQDRANDSVIQHDLKNFAKRIQLIAAETSSFPSGNPGDVTQFPGVTFSPTKSAYFSSSDQNLMYCTGPETASGRIIFQLTARSKSGKVFRYSSGGNIEVVGNFALGASETNACSLISAPRTWSYGYNSASNQWYSWTNG